MSVFAADAPVPSENETSISHERIDNTGGTIGDVEGVFQEQSAKYGGAISNKGNPFRPAVIGDINADFIKNNAVSEGGAIYNLRGTIGNINGTFDSNTSGAGGAAIYNTGTIGDITADFINNEAHARGGAIANGSAGSIGNIIGDFIGNKSSADGGAISNEGSITAIINSNFINNTVQNIDEYEFLQDDVYGGAIYTKKDLNIIADNGTSVFSGNKVDDDGVVVQNAIYVDRGGSFSAPPTLTLESKNGGEIIFNDTIDGHKNGYNLELKGDDKSVITLNNSINNAYITQTDTNVNVSQGAYLRGNKTLDVQSGVMNISHMDSSAVNFDKFTFNGAININSVDVDLKNNSMGHFSADEYGESNGKINVNGVNILSDASSQFTRLMFADKSFADTVTYSGNNQVYGAIFKYDVSYNPDDGFFSFVAAGGNSGSHEGYNPSVLQSPVTTQAGAYTTQTQTFNYAFQHSDNFMNIPYLERMSIIQSGRYAMSPTGDAADVGTFSPLLTKEEDAGFWVKPYVSFENIPLKNGPKVSNINYGTLIGYDSNLTSISKGWERVLTGYIGYNGASQRYSGVDAYQNGGLVGGTATLYKGNFFNATTLSVGATAGDATGMYGSENYTMLLAGIGNKTGYNIEFKEGKVILQPSFLVSYTFVNTFDYNNAAGVRIKSDPLNAIQLAPGLKLIGNTKNGWQPYIGVSVVWNLLDKTKVTANDVRLPEMSIKPYVQYGAGVQKKFNDRFIAFGQAMIHNGGRNGISLTGGIRWTVGKS